jgi:hypothetical protein
MCSTVRWVLRTHFGSHILPEIGHEGLSKDNTESDKRLIFSKSLRVLVTINALRRDAE